MAIKRRAAITQAEVATAEAIFEMIDGEAAAADRPEAIFYCLFILLGRLLVVDLGYDPVALVTELVDHCNMGRGDVGTYLI
jgi:hypothetical protein